MPWDEWEQLKASAAERHSTQMQLNQAPAERSGGGGGTEKLKHTDKPWTDAAGIADALRTSTTTAKKVATSSTSMPSADWFEPL
jgi:hypothetical protein